jgi:hypothetical protein
MTREEEDARAFEVLEKIAQKPTGTLAESMRRMGHQPLRPDKIWLTREQWEDIIKGL